ncbi:ABC transporter permease [Vibrio hippocampi]|uniref:ABC3 transporter permease C-terminal domain-containing protein n=1 Tax=Vibrio hippocampi TaxID=654686 RepID=A0ABM8ZNN2_9VIBR|nr:FtsX-like permease family protein [Vibrio hippocampi]CAH0529590.1 hypothetical protein VHP8226_03345 [Vibrio hippocampi]
MTLNRRLLNWSLDEIRQGQLWPIAVSMMLIVSCIFALSALAERMEQVIVKQGKDALTADTVYITANPINSETQQLITHAGLETSFYTRFQTMAFSDNGMQLITVKAVDDKFPLRGDFILQSGEIQSHRVQPNELWLDARIIDRLGVKIGDSVSIGDADLIVKGEVVYEPGVSFNPFQQMPSAYIHQDSVSSTGAIQLGSRVQFRAYMVGDDQTIEQLKSQIPMTPSDRWRDENSSRRTNEIFSRTTQYLSLTVAIIIIMSATTLVLTGQNYVQSRRQTVAMLKSLGASREWIVRWLSIQVLLLAGIAIVSGLAIGFGLEALLRIPLKDLLPDPLPSFGVLPVVIAILSSLLIAIPALGIPLYRLMSVSSKEVFQNQESSSHWGIYCLILVPLIPLLVTYGDNTLVWLVLAGMLGLFALLGLISVLCTVMISRLQLPIAFKLAISRILRSKSSTALQYGALALSLMLLTTIWLVRTDLLQDWQRTLPDNAPNAFAFNIGDFDKASYLHTLDSQNIQRSEAFPIARGRLAKINQQAANVENRPNAKDTDALRRELNFTFADQLPTYNQVVAGQWTETNGVSVEEEVAEALDLQIGDSLTFTINGQEFEAIINTIRKVEWRDMKPNFYFIFTPDVLQSLSTTWLVSFRLEAADDPLISQLSRQYPTVSLMDIRAMGDKIQQLLTQIVWSITVLAVLGVAAGLLLIFTLLRLSLTQRQQEFRLYRTLGASRKRLLATIWAEYGIMALVAGIVATMGAELVVGSIMKFGFDLNWTWHLSTWLAVPLAALFTLAIVLFSLLRQLVTNDTKTVMTQ